VVPGRPRGRFSKRRLSMTGKSWIDFLNHFGAVGLLLALILACWCVYVFARPGPGIPRAKDLYTTGEILRRVAKAHCLGLGFLLLGGLVFAIAALIAVGDFVALLAWIAERVGREPRTLFATGILLWLGLSAMAGSIVLWGKRPSTDDENR